MKTVLLPLTLAAAIAGCRTNVLVPSAPMPTPAEHPGWRSDFVQSNGLRLHYWRTGGVGKPAMVMAHGITDDGFNWASLAEKFEADYDIVMYDARGHGFSDQPKGPYDLASHVADLAGLVKALDLRKPILVGHSMGGATVALLAAGDPDLPRALILEDPADMLARVQPLPPNIAAGWKQMVRRDKATGKAELMEIARTKRHPGWAAVEYERWAESKLLVEPLVIDIVDGPGFGDAGATYPKIQVPTLILKADADAATRKKSLEVASLLPRGKLVHIDGAGHVIRNDRPVETEREIRAFLASLGLPGGTAVPATPSR
jgi:pimeloyl-ACP methyl ester carboxylesterase